MSDTNSDTSAIDQAQQQQNSSSTSSTSFASQIAGFIKSLIAIIIVILLYFSSSGLILFVCKLAQSNILPTDDLCSPYTDTKPNVQQIKTNIFSTNTDPPMSMKMEFPYNDYNSANKVLDMFRDYKEKPRSNFLANYFISITETLINFNYSAINAVMNGVNEMVPESLIVFLGPIFVGFLSGIMLIINQLYFIYLWFAKMGWFFKTNTSDVGDKGPNWQDVTLASPFDWCMGFWLVILFIVLLFFGLPLLAFIPTMSFFWCVFSSILYKSQMNGKNIGSFTVVKDIFKYYKLSIVGLISFFVISLAFSNLGVIPGVFSIVTVLLIYFGIIAIDIFKPIPETNLTPVVSYNQANKTCSNLGVKKEKHGLLYRLLIGQNGGGNITKQLKSINKKLQTK